jgi:splicing factor 3B subunit 3
VDEDPSGTKALWDRGLLSGASNKLDVLCNFHIGETVLSLQVSHFVINISSSHSIFDQF